MELIGLGLVSPCNTLKMELIGLDLGKYCPIVYLFISDCVLCVNGEDFDSGVDDIHTPRQWIVWNMNKNTHIYPEYVVSFKVSSYLNLVNLSTVIEVVSTRSSSELHSIKQAYSFHYNSEIEEDIAHKTNGNFKEILLTVVKSSGKYGGRVDMSMAMYYSELMQRYDNAKHRITSFIQALKFTLILIVSFPSHSL
ncbi:probable inactive poly [ADP-ribose] polymerase SRO4 [Camellia sinensis]|uniref:probable inactive poly [ADP-ribose] polymerase SRO4 n=1 Tax=Camellia sinensis TaxID=4442 RepID=UPI0010358679|nr:probable inactive poly [ADP-ribose] polymerase SRO4 [Camellia sinensis]